ncbi:hypothetical protein BDP27DRAFT_1372735 [Rhodocollybia butyracea]|uniref:Ubiquitin-like protease family profile domain-containing protein n=1 Tax=Rhodocollybia butyracea TaxID=206335 RepID=A0A9P5P8T7_9AGAR|nr:hypothetical protein BDP27DRAFT_1372735 [Rhodocollybia butyracea]
MEDDFQQGGKTFYPRWKHRLMFLGVLGCKGTVTIKFDTRDNTWSHETFDEFRFLCKNAAQHYTWDKAFEAAGVSQDDLIANGKPRAMNTEYQSGKMSSNSPGQSSKASLKFKKIKLSDVDPPTEAPKILCLEIPPPQRKKLQALNPTRAHNTPSGNTPTATKEISGSELTTRIIKHEPELDLSSSELNKHPENTILPSYALGPRPQPNKTRSSGSTSKAAVPNKTIRPKKVSKTDQMSDRMWLNDTVCCGILSFYITTRASEPDPLIQFLLLQEAVAMEIDIFNKKFLIVPINENKSSNNSRKSYHWYLAIIYHPDLFIPYSEDQVSASADTPNGPLSPQPPNNDVTSSEPGTLILTMDSLGFQHTQTVDILGKYLQLVAKDKKTGYDFKINRPVPQQPNDLDCGVYCSHFARIFVEKAEYLINASNAAQPTKLRGIGGERN